MTLNILLSHDVATRGVGYSLSGSTTGGSYLRLRLYPPLRFYLASEIGRGRHVGDSNLDCFGMVEKKARRFTMIDGRFRFTIQDL